MKDHWKCLAACTLVSMCPFQYGRSSQRESRLSSNLTRRADLDNQAWISA